MRRVLAVALSMAMVSLASGCFAHTPREAALPCGGHACSISIQNDGASFLAVRYADSSGRGDILGLIRPASIRLFRIQWVRSATIRVIADIQGGGTYVANIPLVGTRTNEVHFPSDFADADGNFPANPSRTGPPK